MKKLILTLPAALLALGSAFLNAPARADWFADSPIPVPVRRPTTRSMGPAPPVQARSTLKRASA